jgi:hypothetical protein
MLFNKILWLVGVAGYFAVAECMVHPFVPLTAGNIWVYNYADTTQYTFDTYYYYNQHGYLTMEVIDSSTVLIHDVGTIHKISRPIDPYSSVPHIDTTYFRDSSYSVYPSQAEAFTIDSIFFGDSSGIKMEIGTTHTNLFKRILFQNDSLLLHEQISTINTGLGFAKVDSTCFLQNCGLLKIVSKSWGGLSTASRSMTLVKFNGHSIDQQSFTLIDTMSQAEMEQLYPVYIPKPVIVTPTDTSQTEKKSSGLCGHGFLLAFIPAFGIGFGSITRRVRKQHCPPSKYL